MQIGAVDHRIGLTEAGSELRTHRHARDFLGGDTVHHDEIVGKRREAVNSLVKPERLHDAKAVGAHLQPGADLPDLRRLLDDPHLPADQRQGVRRGEPRDARADNEDRPMIAHADTTSTASSPIPWIVAAILSPGAMGPTPSGVPVKRMSPGYRV